MLHQAALPSVPRSIADPLETHRHCVTGTLNVLIAARDAGLRRVVYAASGSAYGDQAGASKVESMKPAPISPYGVAKLTGEYYAAAFSHSYGLETVSLRYFNVFGPRQDPTSTYAAAIPKFITAMLRGEPPTIYGDGTQSRDFTFVDNIVHGNLLACRAPKAVGETINLAERRTNHNQRSGGAIELESWEPAWRRSTPTNARAISNTPAPTSPKPATCSALRQSSASKRASAAPWTGIDSNKQSVKPTESP